MKTKSKILLLVVAFLVATCVFSVGTVKATDTTGVDENTLNLIPSSLSLSVKESEFLNENSDNYPGKIIEKQVKDTLTSNNISLEGYNLYVNFTDIYNWTITLVGNKEYNKEISVTYSNTSNSFDSEKKAMQTKLDKISPIINVENNLKMIPGMEKVEADCLKGIRTQLNDNTLNIYFSPRGQGIKEDYENLNLEGGIFAWVYVFKNDVFYADTSVDVLYGNGFTLDDGTPITMKEIEKEDTTYTEMKNKLNNDGYTNIISAYELKLVKSHSGNIPVSFDVGTDNNGKVAIILHKKQDGSFETFEKTIENGKVSIEVTELSPFMVAIKDTATTTTETTTNNTKKLDNEPKTGVTEYVTYASIIALISIGGIAILKFKK